MLTFPPRHSNTTQTRSNLTIVSAQPNDAGQRSCVTGRQPDSCSNWWWCNQALQEMCRVPGRLRARYTGSRKMWCVGWIHWKWTDGMCDGRGQRHRHSETHRQERQGKNNAASQLVPRGVVNIPGTGGLIGSDVCICV